jgi:hypothetical protein
MFRVAAIFKRAPPLSSAHPAFDYIIFLSKAVLRAMAPANAPQLDATTIAHCLA